MGASTWRREELFDVPIAPDTKRTVNVERARRELALVEEHLNVIWRFLRRLGCSREDADDMTQEVFVTAVRKLDQIEAGRERAFLYGVAVRLASRQRRSQSMRIARTVVDADVDEYRSSAAAADELLDRKSGLAFLDRTLAEMTPELRTAFTLYELEELTLAEIATLTELPMGTVASRLRRAREQFQDAVKREQLRQSRMR